MFFDIGSLELLTIFVIAVLVLGPDKLPKAVSDTTALIRKVRVLFDSAQNEIRQELGPDFTDLQLRDLHPRTLAQKAFTGVEIDVGLREITQSLSPHETVEQGDSHSQPVPARAQPHPTVQARVDLGKSPQQT